MNYSGELSQYMDLQHSRRRFLGVCALTAAGVAVPSDEADAFFNFLNPAPVSGIPDSWVRAKGMDVQRYAKFVRGLNLRHLTPKMVLAPHFKTRRGVYNSLPPRSSWRKIAPTLKVIDKMSSKMRAPVREISSAYRSPRYNRAVRGNSRSYHMRNMAIDVKFEGASPWEVASVARDLRKRGVFRGGIGRYSSFVHVDTRGYNSDW